jgi:ADP-heptose:LPS heptosyltransferase
MKALIVRLSSIGDVVHTLPALAALRRSGWDTGWVVEPPGRPLLEGHPMLERLVAAPAARGLRLVAARHAVRALRGQRYDAAIDFEGLWKSAAWARLSGAKRCLGYGGPWRRQPMSAWILRETVHLPADLPHVIDRNLSLLRPLGVEAVGLREFPLPPSEKQARAVEAALAGLGSGPFAILNPGGGWTGKLWPPHGYAFLARGLRERGILPLVTWGPGEERLAERVVTESEGAAVKCFPTTLLELVELARRARLVVAADSGPLHLACAVGTPVVGIYGPTDPARNGPFSARDRVVRRTPICSPCHRRRCATHEGVMEAIEPSEVLRAVDGRLSLATAAKAGAL